MLSDSVAANRHSALIYVTLEGVRHHKVTLIQTETAQRGPPWRTSARGLAAARLGFVTRNASQFRAPPRLQLDASKPVVLCRNEHLVRPKDRLAVLLKAREAACGAVVAAADRHVHQGAE